MRPSNDYCCRANDTHPLFVARKFLQKGHDHLCHTQDKEHCLHLKLTQSPSGLVDDHSKLQLNTCQPFRFFYPASLEMGTFTCSHSHSFACRSRHDWLDLGWIFRFELYSVFTFLTHAHLKGRKVFGLNIFYCS